MELFELGYCFDIDIILILLLFNVNPDCILEGDYCTVLDLFTNVLLQLQKICNLHFLLQYISLKLHLLTLLTYY